jgi:hypothetical protein
VQPPPKGSGFVHSLSAPALQRYAPLQAQIDLQPHLRELARLCLRGVHRLLFPVPLTLFTPPDGLRSTIIPAILIEELRS